MLLHGRSADKLEARRQELAGEGETPAGYVADLSDLTQVARLAETVATDWPDLDVLINNAGVFRVRGTSQVDGLDVRFVVNTIAPYLLTKRLRSGLGPAGRIVNVSSAAQAPVDLNAFVGHGTLDDGAAYAQSKLALNVWSRHLAHAQGESGPAIIAVNPGSMLASKMVKEAYGVAGRDLGIGARILERAALDEAFAQASGAYFDNDAGEFAPHHPAALNEQHAVALVEAMEQVLQRAGV